MTRDRHITGMSLTETLLAAVVIAMLLSGLVVASNSLRTGIADRQTRETLQKLQVSLAKYHEMHHRYPEGPTEAAMAALMKDAHTRAIIRGLDLIRDNRESQGSLACLDGYGHPVFYIAPQPGARHRPEFVSAGKDALLGDQNSKDATDRGHAIDNLYGSDMEALTP